MKKRAFICGYYSFPRGCAASNYVQYLALALMEIGYSIVLITNENTSESNKPGGFLDKYKSNISLDTVTIANGKVRHYIDYQYRLGHYTKEILNKYEITSEDLIVSYSRDLCTNMAILNVKKKTGAKAAVCITEWFPTAEFKFGKFNRRYLEQKICMNVLYFKFDYVFPISEYICNHFRQRGKAVLCLPIMADPNEFDYVEKTVYKKRKFIYPANGKIKDSIDITLNAFAKLSEEELNSIELHISGIKYETLINLMPETLTSRVGKEIIVHQWMEYKELVSLYKDVNYLIISRGTNQMTLSNFPSKVPETMAYGVVPIISDVGDYTKYYLRDNEDSIFIEENSIDACLKVIKKAIYLKTEDLKSLSENARTTCVTKFYYKVWCKQIKQYIFNDDIR